MTLSSYTVTQVNRHIKEQLDGDALLQDLWIEGEISNWRRASSGHCAFR